MSKYHDILKQYWGYSDFRSIQMEIIESIAEGKDTLGLMPTGGGKSITYQVFSLSTEGVCIVVTPLIALMRDQVEGLKRLKIKASAIYSGMSKDEVKMAYNNVVWGGHKFLYVSPERLTTDSFLERLPQMNVNLVAIDESHCISQWGYDFRPSYLKISELRTHLPKTPFLALTATATERVVGDIQERLKFKAPNVVRMSFVRDNLNYRVRYVEDKMGFMIRTIAKAKGSGIIYVRSRKKAREIAQELSKNRISADFYHAGLSTAIRNIKQSDWIEDRTRVIVATNAFGMGIDKSDCRFVIHIDCPDSLEAYYQEAGRAGRDGKRAVAVLLYNNSDATRLRKGFADKFPPIDTVRRVYDALGNHLNIPIGFGKESTYDFKVEAFAVAYRFSIVQAYNCLKILQRDGYLELTDNLDRKAMILFTIHRDELYKFQVKNTQFDSFIRLLLRTYSGVFSDYRAIDEEMLVKKTGTDKDTIYRYLTQLAKSRVIHYIPRKNTPFIFMLKERLEPKRMSVSVENYNKRKAIYESQVQSVIDYASKTETCRSMQLVGYFNEKTAKPCGACDVCLDGNHLTIEKTIQDNISKAILAKVQNESITKEALIHSVKFNAAQVTEVLRRLMDQNVICEDKKGLMFKAE